MFSLLFGGLVLAAFFVSVVDLFTRQAHARPDLYLAGAAATPAAVAALPVPVEATPRFFTVPLVVFDWHGASVHLTAPDVLAIVSSAVLLVRFLAWALAPLRGTKREGE